MRCHGGKTKLGRQISEVILEIIDLNRDLTCYIEPFCGMCGVLYQICKNKKEEINIYATDKNESIIKMWQELQLGWVPSSTFTRCQFEKLKNIPYSSREKGFFGHVLTFGGLYFQFYQEVLEKSLPSVVSNATTMARIMKDVNFFTGDYESCTFMRNSVIFCDPPYSKYNRYYDEKNNRTSFDTEEFWDWVLFMSTNNIVIVNELLDEAIIEKTGAEIRLKKTRKCKYDRNSNEDIECLYVIDNRRHKSQIGENILNPHGAGPAETR